MDTKEAPKASNPYARPTPGKCFKCNQGHCSCNCPLRRAIHLADKDDENDNEVCCEPDGDGEYEEDYKDDDEGHSYVVRKLMLTSKQ